jgi:hypothetical protein
VGRLGWAGLPSPAALTAEGCAAAQGVEGSEAGRDTSEPELAWPGADPLSLLGGPAATALLATPSSQPATPPAPAANRRPITITGDTFLHLATRHEELSVCFSDIEASRGRHKGEGRGGC